MKKRYRLLLYIGTALLLSGCKDIKEEEVVPVISDVKEEKKDTVETIASEVLQEWQMGTLHRSESEDSSELQFRASCDEELPNYSIEIKSPNGELFQTIVFEEERTPDLFQPNILVADANLDGNDDILLYLGIYGNDAIEKYACYVFDMEQQQYVSVEGFGELSNPSVDGLFCTTSYAGLDYQVYKKYRLDGKELVLVGELTEKKTNSFEGDNECIYDETLYAGDEILSQKCDVEDFEVNEDFWGDYVDLSYTMEEIEETFFGEWEVSKLLGFSEIQSEYTNYPDGHDIIGNRIIINKDVFSSVGLEKYERYQSEVLNPTYEVPDIVDRFLIYSIDESIKEETELYDMLLDDKHQTLEISGMRDGKMNCPPAVQIEICNRKLVILTMDGAYYLLERVDQKDSDFSEDIDLKASVINAFCKALCNEKTFFCTTKLPYDDVAIIYQGEGYLCEMPFENTMDIVSYAIVNMDGDIIPEIVLELENYLAFIILRYHEGDIYGNVVNYRALRHLNENGTFSSNSGADWGAIRKLYYVGDTIVFNEAVQMQGVDTYYRHDLISDGETWDEIYNKFFEIPEVEWYEYDEESIVENIVKNPLFEQLPNQLPEKMEERQRYLDSLSYLLDFTYDEQKEDEEKNKARAISYYNGCVYEMSKIYELCQEKLTQEEWETLQKEHANWQNTFDKRLAEELAILELISMEDLLDVENGYRYWNYGDIVLRHVLRLLDAYYGCQFYEVFP